MRQVIIAAVLGMVISANAEAAIKEGQWSISVTTRVAGTEGQMAEMEEAMANMSEDEKAMMQKMMGGVGMQAGAGGMTTTISQCVTNDNPVPQSPEQEDCETTHTINGDTVHFESVCENGTSTGDITYEDETMNGVINSTADGQDVTIELNGQYEGPCTDES